MFTINEIQQMNSLSNYIDKDDTSLLDQKPYTVSLEEKNERQNSTILRIIKCRIEFLQIGEVDTMNERYQAIVKIKAKWYEDEIITEYDKNKYWNPKLFIENALHEKFQEEITYSVKEEGSGTIVTQTMISKGSFWERMELVS
jgi:hypothetical protein